VKKSGGITGLNNSFLYNQQASSSTKDPSVINRSGSVPLSQVKSKINTGLAASQEKAEPFLGYQSKSSV